MSQSVEHIVSFFVFLGRNWNVSAPLERWKECTNYGWGGWGFSSYTGWVEWGSHYALPFHAVLYHVLKYPKGWFRWFNVCLWLSHATCSSRNNPYPAHERSSEIPRGRGVLKVKILEAKYEAKLEFLGGGGCKTKTLPWGEYGFFSGTAQLHNFCKARYSHHGKNWLS